MSARWWAFAVWAVAAASAVYWGLQLFVVGRPAPPHAVVAMAGTAAPRGDLTRVLGSDPPPAPAEVEAAAPESSRFQLVGTVAARGGGQGLAVIAVDGKTPRTYRVGSEIDNGTVLQSVQLRSVALGPRGGNATVALDIPPPAPASTGVLPGATSGGMPQQQMPQATMPQQQPQPIPQAQPQGAGTPPTALRIPGRPVVTPPRAATAPMQQQPQPDGNQRNADVPQTQ